MKLNYSPDINFLTTWKKRHGNKHLYLGIHSARTNGEELSAETTNIESFRQSFKECVKKNNCGYNNIFNADETALFYKQIPRTAFVLSDESKIKGIKQSTERVSVLLCTNWSGKCKLMPLALGIVSFII